MLNVTPAIKKVTMQTSAQKSQKTIGGLGNLHLDGGKNRGIRTGSLHLVSHHLQGSDRGPAGLKKRSQSNESSFRAVARPQDLQDQRWSSEDRRHYSGDLRDDSFHLFCVR